jgi:acyl-CoA synthetase (AMP-forming)/AMP-acid ligase II
MNQGALGSRLVEPAAGAGTLTELLQLRAALHPDRPACVHLEAGETPAAQLSYAELWSAARGHAVALSRRACPGARVLLVFPNEPRFVPLFLGCLLAGLVAVPVAPPRNARGLARIRTLAKAAGADVIVLSPLLRGVWAKLQRTGESAQSGPNWIFADEIAAGDEREWADPRATPDTLAVLQFTSGSTGDPKGVMVRHDSILHNARMFLSQFAPETEIRLVTWLPFFHDWGLFGCLVFPLVAGGTCFYYDAADFVQKPRRWLEAVAAQRGTVCCAPNFAIELAAQAMGERDAAPLDLSSLVMVKVGAEPVRRATLELFDRMCAPHGFDRRALRPSYGLAESTLLVTGGGQELAFRSVTVDRKALEAGRVAPVPAGAPGSRDLVACGAPLLEQEVRIVDPRTRRAAPPGTVGEVWISGPSVAGGYWQRPEETARDFAARIESEDDSGRWLRSGDLGFFDAGELCICGRLKDVIIKSGANYFAEDLELSVDTSHPDLRLGCGAAFSIEAEGAERLVVVQEVNFGPRPDLGEVIGAIQRAVSLEHAVQADAIAVLRPGTLEKTSSGKVRRRHTKALFLAGALDPLKLWQGW